MKNCNIIIRDYKIEDLDEIVRIEQECFSQPWSINALKDFADSRFSRIYTAELDGVVAGYLTFTSIFDELQIANVAVATDFRRMHIGSLLIDKLIENGADNNCSIITLEVRASNNAAISLYSKKGFSMVGERKGYYSQPKEDALLMNYVYSC